MKKITVFLFVFLFACFQSCDTSKSVSKNLVTGMSTKGDGLSCEDVYLSDGEQEINRNKFTYGEKVYVNFVNITGFNKEEGNAFPGMRLSVVGQQGDEVMSIPDLYADYQDGIDISPLLLKANLTLADPIHSEQEYTLYIYIWDKKGDDTFNLEMDFEVKHDERIKIDNTGLSYNEIYLFSKESGKVLLEDDARFDEHVYLIFEGLEGFLEEAGEVSIGLALKVTDAEGEILIDEMDLIGDSTMDPARIKDQLLPNFIISDQSIAVPVKCEIKVWDKKSDNKISTSVELALK